MVGDPLWVSETGMVGVDGKGGFELNVEHATIKTKSRVRKKIFLFDINFNFLSLVWNLDL